MKSNMNQFKWMRGLGNASYIIGIAFLIAALLASAIPPQSVIAGKELNKDVCPNIDGKQETVPDGMQLNSSGDCVPIMQPPTDVCPNIDGIQETVPEGMQLDKKGDCVPIPPPPTDICPNIDGIQETIPDGMQLDNKGDCVPIPHPPDLKLNLSHIECVEGSVEIHFVLLNVPDGITPGTLTYTYGTISPSKDTGNVWHYSDYKPDGYYDVTNASVDVGGTTVNLHNPGEYKGNYTCSSPPPPCSYDPSIPADDPLCLPCQWNPQIPADDPACFKPCEWNPQIPADDPACFKPCEWNPNIPAGETTCKPSVSFGSCYNPIKGLFELKVVNKDVVGYYIGYDVYGESGIYNLGYFNAGESKSFDVPLLNGNNDTLRKYASLTGGEPWTAAGGTHVFDPNTENVCEYDPARVEVSCNPYVDQKLTWTIYNDNNYPLDYFWTWSISSEPGGMGNVAALSSGSFATEYKPATMQIRLGSLQFYIEPEDCKIPPKDKTPTQPPRITPTVKVRTVAPPVVTPEILIPVTGVDLSSGGNLKMTLVNLGLAFLGLGLVLNGFARSRKDWDI